jgi:hypothetical protein
MKATSIKAVFTNLLFVLGVILIILGASRGTSILVRLVAFEKYPLGYYPEARCRLAPAPISENGEVMPKVDINCEESLELERKIKLTDDVVNSVTFLVAGIVLALGFRRFIFESHKVN